MPSDPQLGSHYISASAGTGKTYALSSRFAALVAAGVPPESVCALTFTRAAAREIFSAVMQRVLDMNSDAVLTRMTEALPRLSIYTIDAFSVLLARLFAYELGVSPDLMLYDAASHPEGDAAGRAIVARALLVDAGRTPEDVLALLDAAQGSEDFAGRFRDRLLEMLREHSALMRDTAAEDWGNIAPFGLNVLKDCERKRLLGVLAAADFSMCPPSLREKLAKAIANYPGSDESIRGFKARVDSKWFQLNYFGGLPKGAAEERKKRYPLGGEVWEAARRLWDDLCARDLLEASKHTLRLRHILDRLVAARSAFSEATGAVTFDGLTETLGDALREDRLRSETEACLRLRDVCYRLNSRIRHLMIDEFQDTSSAQWQVLSGFAAELAAGDDATLYYVGDRKQAIYGWRGGDATLFGDKSRVPDIPEGPSLNESYRSSPAVIELVNASMSFPDPSGGKIPEWLPPALAAWRSNWRPHTAHETQRPGYAAVVGLKGDARPAWNEALVTFLVRRIGELRRSGQRLSIAVLGFQNSLFVPDADGDDQNQKGLLESLRAHGIPCALDGKRPVGDTPLGRWMVTWLRWLDEPRANFCPYLLRQTTSADAFDAESARRWNRRLFEYGAPACLERLMAESVLVGLSDYDLEVLESIRHCLETAERAGERNPGILAARLEGMKIPCAADRNVVSLMTVHHSKGLTFDVVFTVVSGEIQRSKRGSVLEHREKWVLERPTLAKEIPHPEIKAAMREHESAQANERLCCLYVGITRARYEQTVLVPMNEMQDLKRHAALFCLHLQRGPATARRTLPSDSEASQDNSVLPQAVLLAEYGTREWTQEASSAISQDDEADASESWQCAMPGAEPGTELPSETAMACTVSDILTHGHGGAKRHGISFHDRLAAIGWTAHAPVFEDIFDEPKEPCILWRERPFVVTYADTEGHTKRIAGQFDRVHIFGNRAVIYDFKTGSSSEVTPAYRKQMNDYRCALTVLTGLPQTSIRAVLLFTGEKVAVEVPPEAMP